ncbi:hypothetical protein DXG01_016190 [Tephrocybe rancida]|nr:hypothetical protein DXG01_016190 [Tephrocybe rancida]
MFFKAASTSDSRELADQGDSSNHQEEAQTSVTAAIPPVKLQIDHRWHVLGPSSHDRDAHQWEQAQDEVGKPPRPSFGSPVSSSRLHSLSELKRGDKCDPLGDRKWQFREQRKRDLKEMSEDDSDGYDTEVVDEEEISKWKRRKLEVRTETTPPLAQGVPRGQIEASDKPSLSQAPILDLTRRRIRCRPCPRYLHRCYAIADLEETDDST